MFWYSASGLSTASEIALPGLMPQTPDGDPEVTVRLGSVPSELAGATASGPTWQMCGDRFLLRVPDIARFLLESGRTIIVEAERGVAAEEIAIFLLGSVFGIMLHQRGRVVLHASGVRVNGKAVLFCGSSGAGKSTMAAALGARGYSLVTDDLCAITMPATGAPVVQPDGRLLKLWDHAIDKLGLAANRLGAVRETLEKYYVEPPDACTRALPIGAIYMLRDARPPHLPGIESPNVVDAAVCVRWSAYRRLLVARMGQRASYFHAATAIANHAGIFYLTRALDFAAVPDVVSSLEQHWSDTGVLEHVA